MSELQEFSTRIKMHKLTVEDRAMCVLDEHLISDVDAHLGSTWKELDFDSLDKMELIMAMEDEFNIDLPDEILMYFENVGEFIEYIERVARV